MDIMFSKDIAKMFGCSENTLRRREFRKKLGIPIKKVGKRLCCSRSELEKWFEKRSNG